MRCPTALALMFGVAVSVVAGCTEKDTEMSFSSVDPDFGGLQGGKSVRIQGNSLRLDIGYTVYFGKAVSPQVSILDDSTLLAVTPRRAAPGLVDVTIRADSGPVFRIENGFKYINQAAGNLLGKQNSR